MLKDLNNKEPQTFSELIFNISGAIIPYSKLITSSNGSDIYSGGEKIPFHKRNSDYITILKQEFVVIS